MAQIVLTAVGGYYGGPWGAMLGSVIGGIIDQEIAGPTETFGPRLGDMKVTGTEYGAPIHYIEGSMRSAGQLIWSSDRREIATTTSTSKGGPSAENTAYTYEVDCLYLLMENEQLPVAGTTLGVRRIFMNGKLIWTRADDATQASQQASAATEMWTRLTEYPGGPAQLPDPTYEAAVGTNNAPAYRGRLTVFIEGLNLGGSGQMPNLTFECGSYTEGAGMPGIIERENTAYTVLFLKGNGSALEPVTDSSPQAHVITGFGAGAGNDSTRAFYGSGSLTSAASSYFSAGVSSDWDFGTGNFTIEFWVYITGSPNTVDALVAGTWNGSTAGWALVISLGVNQYRPKFYFNGSSSGFQAIAGDQVGFSPNYSLGVWSHITVCRVGATLRLFTFGTTQYGVAPTFNIGTESLVASGNALVFGNSVGFGAPILADGYLRGNFDNLRIEKGIGHYAATFVPDEGQGVFARVNPPVADVVSRLCVRAGLTTGQIDVTALSSITRNVRGIAVPGGSDTRASLDLLASAYYFESVLSDKLYFRPRGAATVATIPWADIGASNDPNGQAEPLALRPLNDMEIPAVATVGYIDQDADYETRVQSSDRLRSTSKTTAKFEMALVLTSSEAKGIADAIVMDRIASALTTKVRLTDAYSRLEPTDPIMATALDGSLLRLRLTKLSAAAGVREFEAILDDASVLTSAGITMPSDTPTTVVTPPADTEIELMDIPIARDADNAPGIYVAAKGNTATYPGANIYQSANDADYVLKATVSESAVFGTATTVLGDWTGSPVVDESNTVTVDVGNGTLASSTRDAMHLDGTINAMLIGSEIVRFISAVLQSAGVYKLSGLSRGQRGTEWAMTGHAADERVVHLQNIGLRRIEHATGEIGVPLYYKGVTLGRRLSTAASEIFTDTGVGLKPFSPVDLRAFKDTNGAITLSWKRRTRLATRFTGTGGISVPLGEASESYVVEVYGSAFAAVVRSISSAVATVTYTAAQQVADWGALQTTVYVRIYQVSASVGNGYPLQATVVPIDSFASGTADAENTSSAIAFAYAGTWLAYRTVFRSGLIDTEFYNAAAPEGPYTLRQLVTTALGSNYPPRPIISPGKCTQGASSTFLSIDPFATHPFAMFTGTTALAAAPSSVTTDLPSTRKPHVICNQGTFYLAICAGNNIYSSTDGAVWTSRGAMAGAAMPLVIGTDIDLSGSVVSNCDLYYIGTRWFLLWRYDGSEGANTNRLFYADDTYGVTWTAATGLAVVSGHGIASNIAQENSNLYVAKRRGATSPAQIFVSADNGATWTLEYTATQPTGYETAGSITEQWPLGMNATGNSGSDFVRAYTTNGITFEKPVGTTSWSASASGLRNPANFVFSGGLGGCSDYSNPYVSGGVTSYSLQAKYASGSAFAVASGL